MPARRDDILRIAQIFATDRPIELPGDGFGIGDDPAKRATHRAIDPEGKPARINRIEC